MKIPHCDVACSQITLDNFVGGVWYILLTKSRIRQRKLIYIILVWPVSTEQYKTDVIF